MTLRTTTRRRVGSDRLGALELAIAALVLGTALVLVLVGRGLGSPATAAGAIGSGEGRTAAVGPIASRSDASRSDAFRSIVVGSPRTDRPSDGPESVD